VAVVGLLAIAELFDDARGFSMSPVELPRRPMMIIIRFYLL
jgi:hypothetical protein